MNTQVNAMCQGRRYNGNPQLSFNQSKNGIGMHRAMRYPRYESMIIEQTINLIEILLTVVIGKNMNCSFAN